MSVKFLKDNLSWKNTGIGTLFLLISSVGFILGFMFIFAGLSNFLYLIRIEKIPVILIQLVMIILALAFSISISLLLIEWVVTKRNPFRTDEISVKHKVFFSLLLIITILDASLFYVNIVAIISASLLFWLSKTRVWKILGFVAVSLCLVMQLVTYFIYWR